MLGFALLTTSLHRNRCRPRFFHKYIKALQTSVCRDYAAAKQRLVCYAGLAHYLNSHLRGIAAKDTKQKGAMNRAPTESA